MFMLGWSNKDGKAEKFCHRSGSTKLFNVLVIFMKKISLEEKKRIKKLPYSMSSLFSSTNCGSVLSRWKLSRYATSLDLLAARTDTISVVLLGLATNSLNT
jgi:hypothetical protein